MERLEVRCAPAIFNPAPDADAASLRAAIAQADSNSDASNTIMLQAGDYQLSNLGNGHLLIDNTSGLPDKTLTFIGQGRFQTFLDGSSGNWHDRIIEVAATAGTVAFQDLTVRNGQALDGGQLGGSAALGGGLLIDGGQVSLSQVGVMSNQAIGKNGSVSL